MRKRIMVLIILSMVLLVLALITLILYGCSTCSKETIEDNPNNSLNTATITNNDNNEYSHVVEHIDGFFEKYKNLDEEAGKYLLNDGGPNSDKMTYGEIQSLIAKTIAYEMGNIEKKQRNDGNGFYYMVYVKFRTIDVISTLEGIVDIYAEGDITDKQMDKFKKLIHNGNYVPLEIEGKIIVLDYGSSLCIQMNNILSQALTGGVSGYPY